MAVGRGENAATMDSYWVRSVGFPGFQGPFSVEALRAAVAAGTLRLDVEVRKAAGHGQPEALDGSGWTPLHALLGVSLPPPPPSLSLPAPALALARVREDVRSNTAYGKARMLLRIALVPGLLYACLPLILLLRNRLKYALTGKEVTSILMQRLVEVDGKVRTDKTYPVGFMDVVDIPKTGGWLGGWQQWG